MQAGAEAEVVAESLRGASGAISALQGEVGAATAAAQGARQQASGAAAAVAALEQQVSAGSRQRAEGTVGAVAEDRDLRRAGRGGQAYTGV